MRIDSLTAAGLQQMIANKDFLSGEIIPVTIHRAKSMLLNPDLEKDDIILNIARDEKGHIIGFTGALPGKMNDGTRFAWNSGWWVDPARGREVAMPLFYSFLKQWDMKVMFSDLTPRTFHILTEMKVFKTRKMTGIRIYLRSPLALILPPRNSLFGSLAWLFKSIDFLINIFVDLRLAVLVKKYRKSFSEKVRRISTPKEQDAKLINECASGHVFGRDVQCFDWILHHPWLLRTAPDIQKKKYQFSSFVRRFEQRWIRVSSGGEGEVLLLVTIRDRHLKIPYIFYREEKYLEEAARIIVMLAVRKRVSMITSFHPILSELLTSGPGHRLLKRTIYRMTAVSNELTEKLGDDFLFQDGDGDAVFT